MTLGKLLAGTGIVLAVAVWGLPASAQVYRWTDAQGVVHYSGTPHTRGETPATLPKLQTFSPKDHDDPLAQYAGHTAVAPAAVPRVVSPSDGATIRVAAAQIPVTVQATLAPGQGLVYYVDGKAQNTVPTSATDMEVAGLWRGTHHISVAVVGASGGVVARSAPVTVYMKQPVVHHHHP
ncbi:MAG TPA: DUF4124 domain-containing protein [Nevskiaceae bacterium]|nr:DUF4124 domain-containing protein [Nevskiaceae bacterium]